MDLDLDLDLFLDPDDERDDDRGLILFKGLRLGLGDFEADREGDRRIGLAAGLGGGVFDLERGRSGGKALFFVSLTSFTVSFPSTLTGFVSFFVLRVAGK